MIEENTNYAYKLKYIEQPSFDKVRMLAVQFMKELPQQLRDELYNALNHGLDVLDSEPQMVTYLYSFGQMHKAKLTYAFGKLRGEFLHQEEISIIDYGCGQAMGTMCYADFLRENGYSQKIKNITLIEPSEMCLKRAALHTSVFFPDVEIKTVNKKFDDLTEEDIVCNEKIPTLHILSNVLDLEFDLNKFTSLVNNNLEGYNQFVCVGPYFGSSGKGKRMGDFCSLLEGNKEFYGTFDKNELVGDKTWTAQILIFSDGKNVETKHPITVTNEEIENNIEDKWGVYSKDGQKLLKCTNSHRGTYTIKKGTKVICENAFEGSLFSQIIIPDSVVKIEWQAFLACKFLQTITIPNSVTSIGYNAFGLCESLQQINIPDSVSSLGPQTFYGCISLQQVTISNSLSCIHYHTFANCKSLKNIIIPNLITYIGEFAFSNCASLEYITLSNSLRSIGHFAFEKCQSLKTIACPDSVKHIYAGVFSECVNLQQIIIPDSVTEIGDEIYYEKVFNNCVSLRQIIIPKGSTEKFKKMLDEDLWDKIVESSNIGLNSLYSDQKSLPTKVKDDEIENGVEDELGVLYSSTGEKVLICYKNEKLLKYSIKFGTKSICDNAFFECESLQQIVIPNTVTNIGNNAFAGCVSLEKVIVPNSVTSIGHGAFMRCSNIELEIESNRFIAQDSLLIDKLEKKIISYFGQDKCLFIPYSIKTIGHGAFCGCNSLQQVFLSRTITKISDWSFGRCESLQYISIPNTVMNMGNGAFNGCESLERIEIPDSITYISDGCFSFCESLLQIIIPDSVISIGSRAFEECVSLQQITIPGSVTSIGELAFGDCLSLEIINIPNSVKSIGDIAFGGCVSLQKIVIPHGSTEKFKKMLDEELWDKLVEE